MQYDPLLRYNRLYSNNSKMSVRHHQFQNYRYSRLYIRLDLHNQPKMSRS